MLKPRTCPSCGVVVPVDRGYIFDNDLNMICLSCQSIIVSPNYAFEKKPDEKKDEAV